jgi:hypothetical protein
MKKVSTVGAKQSKNLFCWRQLATSQVSGKRYRKK